MGAINFRTLTNKSRLALVNNTETEADEDFYNFDFEEIDAQLKKHNFYYFNLFIDYGYYEGFCLRLAEENTKYIYQNTKEKAEAIKELTKIKKILIDFIKNDYLKGCYPSWVTTYITKNETIKELNAIITELKNEIKESYTETTATRQNKGLFEIIKEYEERQKQRN